MRIHDGAYGTLLLQHCHGDETVDDLCVRLPATVVDAHAAYLDGGATVIQTNSFLAHLRGSARRRRELRRAALACAREAAQLGPRPVAGRAATVLMTIGPAGDEARDYWESIEQALDAEVDGVLCETVTSRAIADAFVAAWHDVAPGVADVELLLGCSVSPSAGPDAVRWVGDLAGELDAHCALGLNCCEGPAGLRPVLEEVCERRGATWVMPSAGLPQDGQRPFDDPRAWGEAVLELTDGLPVSGIGGCCGTTPLHVEVAAGNA